MLPIASAGRCRPGFPVALPVLLALVLLPLWPGAAARAQPFTPDAHTLLLLHFDGSAGGAQGEAPLNATGLAYTAGVLGQAVVLAPGAALSYARAGNLVGDRGTLEFWFKPAWNGNDGQTHMLLACGGWGGFLVAKDGADNWRLLANLWGPGGTPEIGVSRYVGDLWQAGVWHHCAFTWGPTALKLYLDGMLETQVTPALAPPALTDATLQLGNGFGGDALDGSIDELRICDNERSAAEIAADYLAGVTLLSLSVAPDPAHVWSTWPVRFTLQATSNLGPVAIPQTSAAWTSSDTTVVRVCPAGDLRALAGGTALLTATVKGVSASAQAIVRAPVLAPTHETLPADLTRPPAGRLWEVPVLVIRYLPTADGTNLDVALAPDFWELGAISLADMDQNILAMNHRLKFALEQGSRFRGYAQPTARPSLGYRVVDQITVYEQTPPGKIIGHDQGDPVYEPDWFEIFARLDVRHAVEDLGVKEIWFWSGGLGHFPCWDPALHHTWDIRGGWESNMSSPATGDISNSNRDPSDLPVYDRSYIVYGYNIRRSQAEAIHDHGHQLESQFSWANDRQDGNTDLFRKKWRGQDAGGNRITGRCGDTHCPPNTVNDYDYENPALEWSDCEDWRPDGTGVQQLANVDTWGNLGFAWPDGVTDFSQRVETQYYIYWMMNMPGYANGLHDGTEQITNWWEFVGDWDGAVAAGRGLHQPAPSGVPEAPPPPPLALIQSVTPNPTAEEAAIEVRLSSAGPLRAELFDTQGRLVRVLRDAPAAAGAQRLTWDGRDARGQRVAAGVYRLHVSAAGREEVRALCVVR